jgi:DNA-binding MarR family transcriptional regulator
VDSPNSTESPNIPADTNRPPAAAAIEAVVERYEHMMQRLIAGHAPEFAELEITMSQAKVLYVVEAAGRLRMSELAARLGIGSSSASELADRLVDLRLLRRGDDPVDRRQVVVTATPEAHALLERFRELNQRQLRDLLGRLDAGELAVVDESLAILDRAIDRAFADVPAAAPDPRPTHQEKPS